ncbi:hypothetical protein BS50DRAFT_666668 [Corynespora cassiicola Philippines]|uniref:Uncharacterized protein n=1 Tax=Corynespora cassiicola Philippines TaxID=1448308 RepID=A0A2T2NNP8_CORCC|nr:hypothetical protein BS50DRAFT_666668 [Corynespora cassiicola Philippines]
MELSDQTTPKKGPEETASDSPSIPPAPNPSPALEGLMEGLSTDQRTTSASSGHDTLSSTPSQKPKEPNVDLNDNASHIKVRAGSMELLRISEECLTKPPKSPTNLSSTSIWDAEDDEFDPSVYEDLSGTKTLRGKLFSSKRGNLAKSYRGLGTEPTCSNQTKSGGVSTNPWDAEEDEFDSRVYADLQTAVETYRTKLGTFDHAPQTQRRIFASKEPEASSSDGLNTARTVLTVKSWRTNESQDQESIDKEADSLRYQEQLRDAIAELQDPECSDPTGPDIHDQVLQNFFIDAHKALPADHPVQHMHIISVLEHQYCESDLILHAMPRLCDGVATVLFNSDPKALEEFLDPATQIFDWNREVGPSNRAQSVVIRRVGSEVLVATYRNHGFHYLFDFYVKSQIDLTGCWKEVYATPCRSTVTVNENGVDWDGIELVDGASDELDIEDPKFMLYMGRKAAQYLVVYKCWDYDAGSGDSCKWSADGKVSRGKTTFRTDRGFEKTGLTRHLRVVS